MKNPIIYLFLAALIVQCSPDHQMEDLSADQVLIYEQDLNLYNQMPNVALDELNKGLYVGTLATTDLSFHEKIVINIENDGHLNAQIPLASGKAHLLRGSKLAKNGNVYQFEGLIGHFTVVLENNEATITDAVLDNKAAVINVRKSTSTSRMMPSLGTFRNGDNSVTGTWDFMFYYTGFSYDSDAITIVKNGGNSHQVDVFSTFSRFCDNGNNTFTLYSGSSNDATLAGMPLTHDLYAESFVDAPECPQNSPHEYDIYGNTWSWNGQSGNLSINFNSLPWFN